MSPADPQLSVVVARLERTTDPAAFLAQLRREVDALAVAKRDVDALPLEYYRAHDNPIPLQRKPAQ